jgi:hypothetical protein
MQCLVCQSSTSLEEKNCEITTLNSTNLHGNAKKGLDDFFFVQGISLFH